MGSEANSCLSSYKFAHQLGSQMLSTGSQTPVSAGLLQSLSSAVAVSLIPSKQESPGIRGLALQSNQLPFSAWVEYNTE